MTEIPNGWRYVPLEDLLVPGTLTYGIVQPGQHDRGGIPIVRIKDLERGRVNTESPLRVSHDVEAAYARSRVRRGDVLLSLVGSVGTCAVADESIDGWNLARAIGLLRPLPEVGPLWISQCLRGPAAQTFIDQVVNTTVQTTLNLGDLRRAPVPLPPKNERNAIAGVLGALDDKIESNRRLQQTAHELLQATFASALDLDGGPWESQRLAAELGDCLAVVETGRRPPGGVKGFATGVPSIGAESVSRAGEFDFSKTKFIPREFFESMKRGIVSDRDVLLYKDGGTPGNFEPHVSMVGQGFPFDEAAINEHVYRLRARPPFSQDFLYAWLSAPATMKEMRRRGTGVAIPSLNSANLRTMPFPQPNLEALQIAQQEAEPVMTALLQSAAESKTLAELRDSLLPELLTGRLRVPVVGELVEAAT